ncbi:MAG: carbon monoxide dehydrogenase subunit G [Saprospiraceae bacterium]|nr:carbon monoxide dehydrogenase subunit G [Saprospiraceae bacterium]
MQLKGKHQFHAKAKVIWDTLMDPDALARITPGVDRLEAIEEDRYEAVADVKIGPVRGSFSGRVEVNEKQPPESFVLHIDQKSKIGNAKADINIHLLEEEGALTTVSFVGKVKMSGLLARTGQRVVSGVANMLARQFFEALEEELDS